MALSRFIPTSSSGPAAKVELELLEDVEHLPDGQLRRHHRLRGVARRHLNRLQDAQESQFEKLQVESNSELIAYSG